VYDNLKVHRFRGKFVKAFNPPRTPSYTKAKPRVAPSKSLEFEFSRISPRRFTL